MLLAFLNDPRGMARQAQAIREVARRPKQAAAVPELDLDGATALEGRLLERAHLARERDEKIRRAKLAAVLKGCGQIACEVCGFDFEQTYGERGREYIECHHRVPLHVSGPVQTRLTDLALLCSNCHRMIHRGAPWLTVAELSQLVRGRGSRTP